MTCGGHDAPGIDDAKPVGSGYRGRMVAKNKIPELAVRAERVLIDRAEETVDPISYVDLGTAIRVEGEPAIPQRGMITVLQHMSSYGKKSWSRQLTAWAVDPTTGEPVEGFTFDDSASAAEVREVIHRRLVTGVLSSV